MNILSYGLIMFPIILIIIIALAFCIYFFIYKKNINNALKKENTKHIRMPGIGSMGSYLITFGLIAFIIFNYFQMSSIQDDIEMMRLDYANNISYLKNDIYELEQEIKKTNSLLSSLDFEVQNFDAKNHTVDFLFTIVPKEVTNNTEITLTLNDNIISFKRTANNLFNGSYTVNIFDNKYYKGTVTITDGNTKKSEIIDDIDTSFLWYKFLPSIESIFNNRGSYSGGELDIEGKLNIFITNNATYKFSKGAFVIEVNGKAVSTKDIDLSNVKSDYSINLEETISVKESDLVELYIIAEDNAGYTHKHYVDGIQNGEEITSINSNIENIYDSNGKLLTEAFSK